MILDHSDPPNPVLQDPLNSDILDVPAQISQTQVVILGTSVVGLSVAYVLT